MEQERILVSRFRVEVEAQGWRLDRYLKHKIVRLSRTRIQRVIKTQLLLDGLAAKPATTLRAGQEIVIRRPAPKEPEVPRFFDVLFDDGDVMAVSKPAGLPMHPTARYHFGTLTTLLRERFPGEPLQIAHRIDRETSGLVLIARGRDAGRALKMAFAQRQIAKKYLALVHGDVTDGLGTIDLPLRLGDGPIRIKMIVDEEKGLPSRTRYRVVERLEEHTLLECRPETGRQHQIRAHLAAIGHPIVGDKLYAKSEKLFATFCDEGWSEALAEELHFQRQALHAWEAVFPHPRTGVLTTATAPLAADMVELIASLRVSPADRRTEETASLDFPKGEQGAGGRSRAEARSE